MKRPKGWHYERITPPQPDSGWVVQDLRPRGSRIEVVPCGDVMNHLLNGWGEELCKCGATIEDGIVVHQAKDGRTAFERGERKVS